MRPWPTEGWPFENGPLTRTSGRSCRVQSGKRLESSIGGGGRQQQSIAVDGAASDGSHTLLTSQLLPSSFLPSCHLSPRRTKSHTLALDGAHAHAHTHAPGNGDMSPAHFRDGWLAVVNDRPLADSHLSGLLVNIMSVKIPFTMLTRLVPHCKPQCNKK